MISRLFVVLEAIAEAPRSAAEVARLIEVDRSNALRLLRQLVKTGYVRRDDATMRYTTDAGRFYALAANRSDGREYSLALVEPLLLQLRNEYNEAVVLAVPASGSMVYVEFLPSLLPVTVSERLGTLRPISTSALGKAYLSALTKPALDDLLETMQFPVLTDHTVKNAEELRQRLDVTRHRGYATDLEETITGVNCVAVPLVLSRSLIGSIGLTGPASRLTSEQLDRIGPALVAAVGELDRGGDRAVAP
jgi:DNA-binding IclR family transcriptional regulator